VEVLQGLAIDQPGEGMRGLGHADGEDRTNFVQKTGAKLRVDAGSHVRRGQFGLDL
jgi:hypothetical protein